MRVRRTVVTAAWVGLLACGSPGAPGKAAKGPPARTAADEAVAVYARGDYKACVKLLAAVHAAGKANIQQRLILARAYLHLNKDGDALAVLRSVLDSDKENPEANRLTGRLLLEAGKHEQALDCLQRAWRLKADAPTAAALGRCHYALAQPNKARAFLELALKKDIRDASISFLLGKICLERHLGALAEKYFLTAEEAGLDSLQLHLLLGKALLAQHKYVGPITVRSFARPVEAGRIADGCVVLGVVPGATGRYKVCSRYSALYEGLTVLSRSPKHADGLYMTARGWLAAGRVDLAQKALKRLAAAEAKSPRVLAVRAQTALAAGDFADLGKCLRSAAAAKALGPPELAAFYYQWGLRLRAAGKSADAVQPLRRAERHTPASAKVLRALAKLYRALGRRADARLYYARLVELFPDAADIDELRSALKSLAAGKTSGGKR